MTAVSASQRTLALIDVQNEYIAAGRPFCLAGIGPSLENCRRLLSHARQAGARIIHVKHVGDGPVFRRDSRESAFIDGFEPRSGEISIEKSKLSCYSNPVFAELLDEAAPGAVYVAGYGSTMCCMATVVDAPLFGHKLNFVHDASWARASGDLSEAELHRNAAAIMAIHGVAVTTAAVIDALASDHPTALAG
ncbi:MAG: hypothetical protein BGP06_21210 [Rhizobiales bacterium 65-9]|nr:cysteine hydrolase [Hyphomicrobiales bacterium]OJY36529.1 MAG: hypothetical protein BGP06_21210 [Rhizobiales bacterium 65-9]